MKRVGGMGLLGMDPADQGFDTDDAAIGETDLGLITQGQSVSDHGLAQPLFDLQPLPGALRHVGRIELVTIASQALGRVHGDIGRAEQAVAVAAVVGIDGDPDAAHDRNGIVGQDDRYAEGVENLLGQLGGMAGSVPPARMRNSSPPKRATVSLVRRALLRRLATTRSSSSPMACPQASLTTLKLSRSRKSSRTPSILVLGNADGVIEPFVEQEPVGQAGERVVVGEVIELVLYGAQAGDIEKATT